MKNIKVIILVVALSFMTAACVENQVQSPSATQPDVKHSEKVVVPADKQETKPLPVITQAEKDRICRMIKAGEYEIVEGKKLEKINPRLTAEKLNEMLKQSSVSFTEYLSVYMKNEKSVFYADYNNDGKEDTLFRLMYDKSGGSGCVDFEYIVYENDSLREIISDSSLVLKLHSEKDIYTRKYSCRGGGQLLVKVNGIIYLATTDRDVFFDKKKWVYPNGKYERKIKRVDLIKTIGDLNVNFLVCEF